MKVSAFACYRVFFMASHCIISPQKKFWVEVRPSGCAEKKPFMVWHDDGVAATANPESATFPDTCEVTLNWPDAELLNKKKGIIVGVRDPVSNQYSVQLQDEDVIKAWGSTVVQASESQIKWRMPENPKLSDKETSYVEKAATQKLPARPYINKKPSPQSDSTTRAPFASPDTLATGSSNLRKDTPAAVSPVKQRSLISRSGTQTFCVPASITNSFFADLPANLTVASRHRSAEEPLHRLATMHRIISTLSSSNDKCLPHILKASPTPPLKQQHHPNQPPLNGTVFYCTCDFLSAH